METLLPLITGGGGALIVLALWVYTFFKGLIHSDSEFSRLEDENRALRAENDGLRAALAAERHTVNETVDAGQTTNQLIRALVELASRPLAAEVTRLSSGAGFSAGGMLNWMHG